MKLEEAYRQGFIDCLGAYAIWNNGVQRIGCKGESIIEIIKDLDNNSMFTPPKKKDGA